MKHFPFISPRLSLFILRISLALVFLIHIGGVLLITGYFIKWISAGFIILLLAGIVIIHAQLGWFVGEFGTGGCEYSFILIMAFIAVAATETSPVQKN